MERRTDGKIKIGVCVMEKKVSCSPMEQILERLRAFGEFEIIIFGDKVILEDHIERYATVVAPEQRVRTRLYFTSESHIHSLMNVLRYGNLDESLNREESLVCRSSLDQLFKTSELDYMSYIVLRMFENTEVPLEHPKRFRIEMKFSRGADISSLESGGKASLQSDDHTMQIMEPERLQEVGSYITLDKFDKMTRPFAMPAEDFPPAAPSQPLSVHFCKDIELQGGRLQHKSDMLSSMPRRKTKKLQE